MNYAQITDGEVTFIGPPPKDWAHISGFNKLSPEKMKEHGWLPMEEVHPVYDDTTHYRISPSVDIQEDKVVYTDVIVKFTDQELKQNKWNDWCGSMRRSDDTMMGRIYEDHITEMHEGVAGPTQQKYYDDKLSLRATKPEKPTL